jgi:hypothetical protein
MYGAYQVLLHIYDHIYEQRNDPRERILSIPCSRPCWKNVGQSGVLKCQGQYTEVKSSLKKCCCSLKIAFLIREKLAE